MYYQLLSVLQVLKPVTSAHWMLESPSYALSISFTIANIIRMEKKTKGWIVPASFMETISNWPTKAGNHVPCENESFLCGCVCVCVPACSGHLRGHWARQWGTGALGTSVRCGCQKKAFPQLWNQWEVGTARSNHCSALFKIRTTGNPGLRPSLGLQPSYLKEAWNFFTSQPLSKPGTEQRWIHRKLLFHVRFLLKFLVILTNHSIQQYHFAGCFINRDVSSALKSLQPTWDRQNTANQ